MDLDDAGCQVKYLIRARDGKFPRLFDTVLTSTDVTVVLTGGQMPHVNAIMKR